MELEVNAEQKTSKGHCAIEHRKARSILTESSGFLEAYDYSINPYAGCAFGCNYCYAAFFARTRDLQANWGYWVQVKENALDLLAAFRSRPLVNKTIYMSSVTDPYQPIERDLRLTRAILEELLAYHQVRLVLQTRGPLVTRDINLLQQFKFVQVNMTVTTDDEMVRKTFEPMCPSTTRRLDAIRQIHESGIQACITMTPLLPVRDPEAFAQSLLATGVRKFVIQFFHTQKTRFVASTGDEARRLAHEMTWDEPRYQEVYSILRRCLPNLSEGKEGFRPSWD